MSNANGRQILEEAKAMEHGEVACGLAIVAEALSIELKLVKQQRAELLEALQKLHSVAIGSVELDDWRELQDALDCAMQAITKAEAAE